MSNALQADASAADAWVEFDIGSDQPLVWLTYEQRVTIAALVVPLEGRFAQLWDPTHTSQIDFVSFVDSGGLNWQSDGAFGDTPPPAGNVWQTVELLHENGSTESLYVNTVLIGSGTASGDDTRFLTLGLRDVFTPDPTSVVLIRNVKLGTTRGGDDLFSWPDTETDLSAWTSQSGDVSVVPAPAPPEVVYTRIYGIQIALSDDGVEQVTALITSQDGF